MGTCYKCDTDRQLSCALEIKNCSPSEENQELALLKTHQRSMVCPLLAQDEGSLQKAQTVGVLSALGQLRVGENQEEKKKFRALI